MQLIAALTEGVTLHTGDMEAPLATRDAKWIYHAVELVEEVAETRDVNDELGRGRVSILSKTFLGIATSELLGYRHVVKVYITFDGVLEITRAKGFLI